MQPIVKIAGIVIKEGKLLMVKKYSQNFLGMLGGTLEAGESYLECLSREIPEEISVTDFNILDRVPFYTANSVAATDVARPLAMHCFKVELFEDPSPTYNQLNPEKTEAGYNISEIHWVGLSDLVKDNSKNEYLLKESVKDNNGNTLTLTPITERLVFPELIELGLIY